MLLSFVTAGPSVRQIRVNPEYIASISQQETFTLLRIGGDTHVVKEAYVSVCKRVDDDAMSPKEQVRRLCLEQGDKLVIMVPEQTFQSKEDHDFFIGKWKEIWNDVIVVVGDIELEVLRCSSSSSQLAASGSMDQPSQRGM